VAIENEHKKMVKHQVWVPRKLSQIPKGAKIIDST
jgi:hypothetical protein